MAEPQYYNNTNQMVPVARSFTTDERISDPNLREFYFGSPDYEGILSEGRRAANRAYGTPFQAKGVAGFSPFANRAMESAYSGIGGYKPYLDFQGNALLEGMGTIGQQKGLLGESLEAYRRAGEMQQPYLSQAEQQYGSGFRDLQSSFGRQGPSARDFQRASLQGFDPRSTAAYYNPFEQQVVQQTIDDVFKQGEKADIAQRARDISTGGESAFGSRARLSAEERRSALGRGLGEALAGIRSGGFDTAQKRAMDESRFGRGALERAGAFEAGLGRDMSGARRNFAGDIMGIGGLRGDIARTTAGDIRGVSGELGGLGRDYAAYGRDMGNLGGLYQQYGRDERSELMGLDRDARQMKQAEIDAMYQADQQNRFAGTKAVDYMRQFMPSYQPGFKNVNTQYGEPNDPRNAGIAAMLGTYRSFSQPYGQGAPGATDMSNLYAQLDERYGRRDNQAQGQPAGSGTAPTTNAGAGGGGYSGYGGGYAA